ncbi:Zn-dependent hydrolase [Bacillus gobiensis]|uniref:Zn-dependent hydrolase n=1 Tax=Bacillus gobiensis TaxID=1441095 RepID=UPI003D2008F5
MELQKLLINGSRLKEELESFASYGRTENKGVTRLSLSKPDILARNYFCSCCESLGMSVRFDDMGNIYATLKGASDAPPIVMGSHLDSVKKGGRFDGTLGVLAALEVVRTLVDHQIKPQVPITIVNFTNEEGARFDPAMMSSGVIAGKFNKREMLQKKDKEGITFEQALQSSGYEGSIENRLKEAAAYLELHIEQGPVLESESLDIGIVEGVVGMVCYGIEVIGESNHAGTTPMRMRKDPLFATNDLITELREKLGKLDDQLVYTMGEMNVTPNIHTVIPNKVVFSLEARHKDEEVIRKVEEIIAELPAIVGDCSVKAEKRWSRDTVWFDKKLCDHMENSTQSLGYSYKKMFSGAGHDAQFIASFIPAVMIFAPSKNGQSHCEEEFTSYEEYTKAANVLLDTVVSLIK